MDKKREISADNIFSKDVLEIYKNCESLNTVTGGFFPVGISGRWHSGIHVIQDCVYPLIPGKIVAYRNCKVGKYNEDYGANFYLLEHEIGQTKIKFYTLYFHVASTEKVLNELAPDGNFADVFRKLKLPFYKKWQFKVKKITKENQMLQYPGENIFPGSCFYSVENDLTVEKMLNRIETNKEDWELKQVYFHSAYLPKISAKEFEIEIYHAEVESYFFQESDLIYNSNNKEEYFHFTCKKAGNFEKKIEVSKIFIKEDLDKKSVNEYEKKEVIIPSDRIGTYDDISIVIKDKGIVNPFNYNEKYIRDTKK